MRSVSCILDFPKLLFAKPSFYTLLKSEYILLFFRMHWALFLFASNYLDTL